MEEHVSYNREQVIEVINSILGRIRTPEASRDLLSRELGDLKTIIESLRSDLQAARPGDIQSLHIPVASDELDAVVASTEHATGTIMDACDAILEIARDGGDELFGRIETSVVRIFEACTFQDITGQRIKKVTNSLKEIDGKIRMILNIIGEDALDGPAPASAGDALLNGPALPADAATQMDIDRLLAEFDDNHSGAQ